MARSPSPASSADLDLQQQAVALAERLATRAAAVRPSRRERRRLGRLGRLMEDPGGKSFTLALTDEVLRIDSHRRAARRFHDLVADEGLPAFLGPVDRLLLRTGAAVAPLLPGVVMPLVKTRLRAESAGMILPAERGPFARHAARRRRDGVRLNVSLLGEAILGEGEAQRRLDDVVELLGRPDVDYVSVKISSICSQLEVLAFDDSAERVAERLRVLYRAAQRHSPPKFVNLDMEEYRDLHLTARVFCTVLDELDFGTLDAGIVLQAYLPDSYAVLQELTEWAAARRSRGGGTVKIRIVKGANLAMEQVEAAMHGWPQAPYPTKADVDANYKRMLDWALDPRWASSVRLGVASHNLFDVAWALVAADARGQRERVEIEMLEGMAEPQARAVRDEAGGILLYAPIARRGDFESTIAYLMRRLDENTGPENFLRRVLSFRAGTDAFAVERDRFLASVAARTTVADGPRRTQDRSTERRRFDPDEPFDSEPDTDFVLAANRRWIEDALRSHVGLAPDAPVPTVDDVEAAVARAVAAAPGWRSTPPAERRRLLHRVAEVMAHQRDRTIVCMVHDAGKVVSEADVEVSEAVDFARWYAESTRLVESLTGAADSAVRFDPLGFVVVASPWNFPYAIPAGGVLAALAAGNTVILKPAPETVATARLLAEQCWEAGIPSDVLQFLPCADDDAGQRLVSHPSAGAVVLTGAWETARLFQTWRPDLRLFAETSGKNAIVVTAAADLDAAVKDIVRSAFGHAGQKCSAASLAIVEASVYDDPAFRTRLKDAVESLHVGPSTDLLNVVGPLIRPPEGPLAEALTTLGPGERWLVPPRRLDSDMAWTPGVKLGVRPGSAFHLTECFGPVLGVLRAEDLDDALALQNAPAFGLTGGIHSLDDREIAHWLEHVEVGNAYINRPITGAIVRRQPFGGWKRSAVGPGAKAGGPNYVLSLGHWTPAGPLDPDGAAASFEKAWADEFAVEHDPSGLRAETNVFRYRPLAGKVLLRAGEDVSDEDVAAARAAARVAGARVVVSSAKPRPDAVVETDAELAGRLPQLTGRLAKLRVLGAVPEEVRAAAWSAELALDDAPVVPEGRVELLHWLREQAVSHTRHRYGLIPQRH